MKYIPNSVTRTVGRAVLQGQKHSPTIMFGAGVVGVVATVVLACRATLKADELLDDMAKDKAQLNTLEHSADRTEEDIMRDKVFFYSRSAYEIAKLYAPAVTVGVVSVGCLTGAHVVLNRRNVAITAAYAAVEKGFREYRERVVNEYGQDKDREFRYGTVESSEQVVGKDGKSKLVPVKQLAKGSSIYARYFDESSKNWQRQHDYNQVFIQCQQSYANDLLRARGHVFLNEVYDMLGLERSKEGAVVGWVLGNGDDYIDFGVFAGDAYMGQEFVNGNERSVLLDFNVDGLIYDKI